MTICTPYSGFYIYAPALGFRKILIIEISIRKILIIELLKL